VVDDYLTLLLLLSYL